MRWLHFLSRNNSGNGHSAGLATGARSENFVQSANTDVALSSAVSALLEKTGANGAAVALAQGSLLVCRASAGQIAPDVGVALSANTGITGACVRSAMLLHCRDAQLDPRVDAAVCRASAIRSILVTPILVDRAVVGLVEALSIHPNAFQPGHVKWLETVADWLRDACYCPNQNVARPPVHQAVSEPKRSPIITDESTQAHRQSTPGPAQSQLSAKRPQGDPGLASFRETLQRMPVASSWEDICRKLVPRFVA